MKKNEEFARDCGGIQPNWSEDINADYLKRGKKKK